MAIEVRIPKEITEYREKILFGLSIRQLLSFAVALTVGVTTYLIVAKFWGDDVAGYLVIFEVMPIFAVGFIRKNGFTFEAYVGQMLRHTFGVSRRRYQTSLLIDELKTGIGPMKKSRRHTDVGTRKEPVARKGGRECDDAEITAQSRKRARKAAIREITTARKDCLAAQRAAKTTERKSGSPPNLTT